MPVAALSNPRLAALLYWHEWQHGRDPWAKLRRWADRRTVLRGLKAVRADLTAGWLDRYFQRVLKILARRYPEIVDAQTTLVG